MCAPCTSCTPSPHIAQSPPYASMTRRENRASRTKVLPARRARSAAAGISGSVAVIRPDPSIAACIASASGGAWSRSAAKLTARSGGAKQRIISPRAFRPSDQPVSSAAWSVARLDEH